MKRTAVLALFFSCVSFSLQAMINEGLKEELKQVAKKDDYFDQADKCYEAICTYVVNNKIKNYRHYCDLFKKECNEEVMKYMPSITEYNVSIVKHGRMTEKFKEVLKKHLKDAKDHYEKQREFDLDRLKSKHCCHLMMTLIFSGLGGFLVGVYEYGVC